MPIYQFRCEKCGHQFEIRQSYNSATELRCPNCEGKAKRKIPIANFTFGFTLSEDSYKRGHPLELVRNV